MMDEAFYVGEGAWCAPKTSVFLHDAGALPTCVAPPQDPSSIILL